MDIFGSLFPRTGRNFIDEMMQQRLAEEHAARQQAAMIANMPQGTGAITNVEPSRSGTIGDYLFGSLSGMGMPGRLASDYAGWGQTAAGMTLPGTLDQLDKGDLEGAAMSIAAGPAKGIKAFHGSPHSFDKFDISKIGTGEGAQAYGHGLYFAENEGVAKAYRDALAPHSTTFDNKPLDTPKDYWGTHDALEADDWRQAKALDYFSKQSGPAEERLRATRDWYRDQPDMMAAIDALEPKLGTKSKGSMYEVNIAADPERFLDWDKPLPNDPKDPLRGLLYDQSSELRGSVYGDKRSIGQEAARQVANPNLTGEGLHHQLSRVTGDKAKAAEAIKQAGIPGIKYLDAGSRTPKTLFDGKPIQSNNYAAQAAADALDNYGSSEKAIEALSQHPGYRGTNVEAVELLKSGRVTKTVPEGSRNYVVFDENLISIVKKYGLAAALGAGLITEEMARQMQEQGIDQGT